MQFNSVKLYQATIRSILLQMDIISLLRALRAKVLETLSEYS